MTDFLILNGTEFWGRTTTAYLKDVLNRLPTQRASGIDGLLPHNWVPPIKA